MHLEFAKRRVGGFTPERGAQSCGEFPLQRRNVAKRAVIGAARAFAGHVGGGDNVDLVAQVIERQQPIKKHEFGIGQCQVIFAMLANFFQLAHHVVREIPDRACRERRQPGNAGWAMLAQQPLHHLENVVLDDFATPSALDFNRSLVGPHPHVRPRAQECVAADLLAAFHRLQQERMRFFAGDRQKGGHRRQQIRADGFHHGDERGLARQPGKLFEIRLQHRLRSRPQVRRSDSGKLAPRRPGGFLL